MTQFTLRIDCTGPAFGEWQTEAARILRAVAWNLDRDSGVDQSPQDFIHDKAGNRCGSWRYDGGDVENKLTTAPDTLPELYDQAARAGENIARFLHLRADKNGRYKTPWGTKTALGLYLSIRLIAVEGFEP